MSVFAPLPTGKFEIIYADPPWKYFAGGDRNAARHYPCLDIKELMELPVADIAADNAYLFMWTTFPTMALDWSTKLCYAWGFKPSTYVFTWVKTNLRADTNQLIKLDEVDKFCKIGNGYYTRANPEFVLLARRGKPPRRINASVRNLTFAPLQEHSVKPEIFRQKIIQLLGDRPNKLELFARRPVEGWTVWGNEV